MQKRSFMNTLNLRFQPYFGMNVWAFFISIYLSNPFFAAIESEKEPWYKSKLIPRYSLENYLPAIGDQGDIGSCTGWATTYYGMTIVKRIERGMNMPVFSPLSTYNRYSYLDKKSPDASGAWILPCLALLTRKGCPTVRITRFLMVHWTTAVPPMSIGSLISIPYNPKTSIKLKRPF